MSDTAAEFTPNHETNAAGPLAGSAASILGITDQEISTLFTPVVTNNEQDLKIQTQLIPPDKDHPQPNWVTIQQGGPTGTCRITLTTPDSTGRLITSIGATVDINDVAGHQIPVITGCRHQVTDQEALGNLEGAFNKLYANGNPTSPVSKLDGAVKIDEHEITRARTVRRAVQETNDNKRFISQAEVDRYLAQLKEGIRRFIENPSPDQAG
jgi:hypothetical protein